MGHAFTSAPLALLWPELRRSACLLTCAVRGAPAGEAPLRRAGKEREGEVRRFGCAESGGWSSPQDRCGEGVAGLRGAEGRAVLASSARRQETAGRHERNGLRGRASGLHWGICHSAKSHKKGIPIHLSISPTQLLVASRKRAPYEAAATTGKKKPWPRSFAFVLRALPKRLCCLQEWCPERGRLNSKV